MLSVMFTALSTRLLSCLGQNLAHTGRDSDNRTNGENEAQGGYLISPLAHGQYVTQWRFEAKSPTRSLHTDHSACLPSLSPATPSE